MPILSLSKRPANAKDCEIARYYNCITNHV
jgi:hypothetical protein